MAKQTTTENTSYTNDSGVHGQYKNWFLEYASYVILERAVPAIEDGLKPVQRRILHAMKEMDDGRYNKVANIIGQSMQYHPHGDASIGDALVNMGQKELVIDTQGNWGDARTGDAAAAARYIEARPSKLALDIAFNEKTTRWQLSYDGRKREPITLPMKFPLLLAQGADGIAVGLSTKILPHNFCEIIDAAIKYLKGKKFDLYPDFITGGMIDATNYNDGKRGGKIRARAIIEELDKKTLVIKSVPYGTTTSTLADSITKANEQGKIKIKKVTDVTAQNVEIHIDLVPGIATAMTIDALYAFTECEVSISPNACVIENNKPRFIGVGDLLRISVDNTKELLKKELEIKLDELNNKWHYTSLEKIFFEEKIYKELERKLSTWEKVIESIAIAFQPFKKQLKREIAREDILKLTEKPVRRIYKLDIEELNAQIKSIEAEIKITKQHLDHLVDYTVAYFDSLLKKHGKGRERATAIKLFDTIQAQQVAITNTKLYINREEGFVGTGLKKDEFLFDCSDIDDIIVFTKQGIMKIVRIGEKKFIGKDILYAAVFKKNDERTTYNMIYLDADSGTTMAKRFNVVGITRDKEYNLIKGGDKSKVYYFSANLNGEAEIVKILLSPNCSARVKELNFSFEELEIKGRSSTGNIVTKYPVRNVKWKEKGRTTLAQKELWYDTQFGRINSDQNGVYLGGFDAEDTLLVVYNDGYYEVAVPEQATRFDPQKVLLMERFDIKKTITAVYADVEKKQFTVKRFNVETTVYNTKYFFIREGNGNFVKMVTTEGAPILLVQKGRKQTAQTSTVKLESMVEVMGWRAQGTKLMDYAKSVEMNWQTKSKKTQEQDLWD